MNLRDRIKALLNQAEAEAQEVKFATAELADGGGTITNNSEEAMAPGQEVFLIVEGEEGDELIPLADGIYMLADGTHVSVSAGIIEEIQPAEEAPAEEPAEEPAEVEASEEAEPAELSEVITGLASVVTDLVARIEALEANSADVHGSIEEVAQSVAKLSAAPAAAPAYKKAEKHTETDLKKINTVQGRASLIARLYS